MPRLVLKRRTCRNKNKRPSGRFSFLQDNGRVRDVAPGCAKVPGRSKVQCRAAVVFLMAFGLAFTSRAQVRHSKTLLDPEIANIYIDGQQCFAIDLRTARTDYVTVEARMEGEYQGDVLVQVEKLGQTLRIGTGFSPAFSLPNDKLGAHKVLSVRLLVEVPEGEDVTVTGAQCQVATSGHYGNLVVQINNGGCQLEHLAEKTVVRTLDAPISAYVPAGVVRASSRHGKVLSDTIPAGVAVFELTSTHGDIHVWNKP